MLRSLIFTFAVLATCTVSFAQEADVACPKVSLHTKRVVPKKGEVVFYAVVVDGQPDQRQGLEYNWTVVPSFDFTGQNTRTIAIPFNGDLASSSLIVSVAIRGLPANCTSKVSESMTWLPKPPSVMLGEVRSYDLQPLSKLLNDEIAPNVSNYPNNQIYVFLGHKTDVSDKTVELREEAIANQITVRLKITRDRVSIQSIRDVVDVIQFWRVPPGADNPTCEECEKLEKENKNCPAISIAGPPGVTAPGDPFVFTSIVNGEFPNGASYVWNVSEGNIISGQGTPSIKVAAQWKTQINLTASLRVVGLPAGCPAEIHETATVACRCTPIFLDEFEIPPAKIDRTKLDLLAAELQKDASSVGYIIEYFPLKTSRRVVEKKMEMVTKYLISKGLRSNQFKMATGVDDITRTKHYKVPPGADFPSP